MPKSTTPTRKKVDTLRLENANNDDDDDNSAMINNDDVDAAVVFGVLFAIASPPHATVSGVISCVRLHGVVAMPYKQVGASAPRIPP